MTNSRIPYRMAHCMECGARLGRAGGAARLSEVSPSCSGGSASPSCSSVSPASESSSSGCVESPLSSSGYRSKDAMPVISFIRHEIIIKRNNFQILHLHLLCYFSTNSQILTTLTVNKKITINITRNAFQNIPNYFDPMNTLPEG